MPFDMQKKMSKDEIKDLIEEIRSEINKIERQNRKFMENVHLMAIWDNLDYLEKDLDKLISDRIKK